MERKENDLKLHDIEDKEQLDTDCENTVKYKDNIGLEYVRKDAIKQYDKWEKEFLHINVMLDLNEKLLVEKYLIF